MYVFRFLRTVRVKGSGHSDVRKLYDENDVCNKHTKPQHKINGVK